MSTVDTKIAAVKAVSREREAQRAAGYITETSMHVRDLSAAFVDALLEWDAPHDYRSMPRMYCGL